MEEMREIVDIGKVDTAITIGGGVWFGLCLLVGFVLMMVRHRALWLQRGVGVGVIGPLVMGLWMLYSWMVRFDPRTGYFGLDKVWVLAVNALIFVAAGCAYGFALGRLWNRSVSAEGEATGGGKKPT